MQLRTGDKIAILLVIVALLVSVCLEQLFYDSDINPRYEMVFYKYGYFEAQPLSLRERQELVQELDYSLKIPINPQQFYPEYVITYRNKKGKDRRLFIFRTARIGWDETGLAFNLNRPICALLDNNIISLETCIGNRYGELISWDEACQIFRKYDTALVTDIDTGKSFWVQRRAGSNHADVQPLTARDSHIMKSIYQGKWSWERRAIIVACRNRRLAASMNGMPHGAGAIQNNDFDGHFCIHFYGSKTHATNHLDERHQRMILKAAGREWRRNITE